MKETFGMDVVFRKDWNHSTIVLDMALSKAGIRRRGSEEVKARLDNLIYSSTLLVAW